MPYYLFDEYRKAIPIISAQETLEGIAVSTHPYKTEQDRREAIKKLDKVISPYKKQKTMEQLEAELKIKGLL